MKRWQSFRFRLIIAYAGLILIGFSGLVFIAGRQISSSTIEDYENRLGGQAELVARGLRDSIEHFSEKDLSEAELNAIIADYASQFSTRISLLDRNGAAWLDSSGTPPPTSQQKTPEVVAAINRQVINDTRPNEFGVDTVYAAAPIIEDNHVLAIVQLSVPLAVAQRVILERWFGLGGGMLLLMLLSLAVSLWLSNSFTRPVAQL
ncbi:MAG: hypothetical protein ACE5EY_14625, partial [Anaerolineae bacterium]